MTEFEGDTTIYCACPYCFGGSILSTIKNKFKQSLVRLHLFVNARTPAFYGCGSEYEETVTIDVEPMEDDRYA